MNRHKINKTTGVRGQSASRIKKREGRRGAHTHTALMWPANQSLTDTACFPELRTYSVLDQNNPKNNKKKTKNTHTAAFYPKGSVTTKSPHSGPHSCCYGRKAGPGEGEGEEGE